MSVNSSDLNAARPQPSSNSSNLLCSSSTIEYYGFISFAITNMLFLLPLSVRVFYIGFQRWRRTTSTPTSHIDLFTYHIVAMELYSMLGTVLYFCGIYVSNWLLMVFGFFSFSIIVSGLSMFHCLTCLERYLAVVHPATYLGLKKTGRVRIRNISIGLVWLLCVGWFGITESYLPDIAVTPFFCLFSLSFLVSSFASLSVLYALTRPSPGERAGVKERVDPSKRRAFHTVTVIMGVLLLRFSGFMVCMIIYWRVKKDLGDGCLAVIISFWLCLPSSLVLPLLFLHRARKQDKDQSRTS